jgi:oligoribonuclease NrnB/cAMP/cGMP phosphodiesterase (DHH superfamily)
MHDKEVAEAINASFRTMRIGGMAVPVCNVPGMMASDAGNILAEGNSFAASYFDGPANRHFSPRSDKHDPNAANVAKVAEQYGGGGHRNAAGFQMPIGWEGDAE